MRNIFNSKYKITQEFGVNTDYYKQFGLAGHEGIDLIPSGTVWDVLCLEDGVVVRDIDDASIGKNYGKNVTVWHPTINKATQYCHLAENNVKMGDRLKRGDKLGIMGATGNTTGAHVHLNLFDTDANGMRLNTNNGYFGGTDPKPFLEQDVAPSDTIPVPRPQFEDFERVKDGWNKVREKLNVEDSTTVVVAEVEKLIGYEDKVVEKDKQLSTANQSISKLESDIQKLNISNGELKNENEKLEEEIKIQKEEIKLQQEDINMLSTKVKDLQKQSQAPLLTGFKKFLYEVIVRW